MIETQEATRDDNNSDSAAAATESSDLYQSEDGDVLAETTAAVVRVHGVLENMDMQDVPPPPPPHASNFETQNGEAPEGLGGREEGAGASGAGRGAERGGGKVGAEAVAKAGEGGARAEGSGGYEKLDAVEVEEFRRRVQRPAVYAVLQENGDLRYE